LSYQLIFYNLVVRYNNRFIEMSKTDNLYCLILAGGKGRRLWPESTNHMPKQFIDFFGTGRTQIQETYERFRSFLPADHIYIITHVSYVDTMKQQIPDIPEKNIIAEPIWRNTAPSTAWGAFRISRLHPGSTIIVAPSDHLVMNVEKFSDAVEKASEFVETHESMVVMGVKPTRPEPGYGYIQKDQPVADGIFKVRSFTEKPNRDFAKVFMESDEFCWNTGIYVAKGRVLLNSLRNLLPSVLRKVDIKSITTEQENAYIQEHFPAYPNVTIEQGVFEKTPQATVMHCDFGWADLGTWHGIYEVEHKMEGDNVVLNSDVILDDAHGNIIKVPKGHLAVINGLNGFIVVEKGDTLLICPREDSSALIRKYSAEVEIR
jgi:mannose-1-phosphate guanylyltransferase